MPHENGFLPNETRPVHLADPHDASVATRKRWVSVRQCSACGKDHKDLLVHSSTEPGNAPFVECPETAIHVYIFADHPIPPLPSDGLTIAQRGRTRSAFYRSDRDVIATDEAPHLAEQCPARSEHADGRCQLAEGHAGYHQIGLYYWAGAKEEVEGDSLVGIELDEPDARSSANTRQVGGEHYGLSDFQHWDMVALFELDYFSGQITKYVMRWRKKNGLTDLQKARHFLDKYIELIEAGKIK